MTESADLSSDAAASERSARAGYPLAAIGLVAVAAACLGGSSRLTWVRVSSADGLGMQRQDDLLGSTWFGALTPLALALLASMAALFATRGGLRQVFGAVIALLGAAAAVPALALLTHSGVSDARARALAELPGRARVTEVTAVAFPPALAFVGACLAFVAGVLLARRRAGVAPSGKAGSSGRYTVPAARRAEATRQVAESAHVSERVLWDALDAGEDPTRGDVPHQPGSTTGSVDDESGGRHT